jgi:hypothetical protein
MHQRSPPAAPGRKPLRNHGERRVERGSFERAIRPRPAHECEELVFAVLPARRLGDDLLRQHIERRVVRDDAIELAAADSSKKGERFDQVVARHREHAALRHADDGVP